MFLTSNTIFSVGHEQCVSTVTSSCILILMKTMGIRSAIGLPTREIERSRRRGPKSNPNYVQYQWNTAGLTLENWQVAHFRVLGNDKHAPYGTSVLEAS
jgi:hypothetical protein